MFLESLQLLSSVGRLSYDMRFKSVKTLSSVLSTWAACSSWKLVQQDYIHKDPVISYYNLQCQSNKRYGPPTSVT